MLADGAASSIFWGHNAPCQPSTRTTTLGSPPPCGLFISIPFPGPFCLCKPLGTHPSPHRRYTGTSLWPPCARGWHPLMVWHPGHGTNRGSQTTSPGCHQGADTSAGRGCGSPGDVTQGQEARTRQHHCSVQDKPLDMGSVGCWGQGQADPAVSLPPRWHCCHGETQLQRQHRVPKCPLQQMCHDPATASPSHPSSRGFPVPP